MKQGKKLLSLLLLLCLSLFTAHSEGNGLNKEYVRNASTVAFFEETELEPNIMLQDIGGKIYVTISNPETSESTTHKVWAGGHYAKNKDFIHFFNETLDGYRLHFHLSKLSKNQVYVSINIYDGDTKIYSVKIKSTFILFARGIDFQHGKCEYNMGKAVPYLTEWLKTNGFRDSFK